MPNLGPSDSLAKLRAALLHFEQSGEIGKSDSVAVVKEHLVRRIAELEAAMRSVKDFESGAKKPQEIPTNPL
jgi:hypothetical protein